MAILVENVHSCIPWFKTLFVTKMLVNVEAILIFNEKRNMHVSFKDFLDKVQFPNNLFN